MKFTTYFCGLLVVLSSLASSSCEKKSNACDVLVKVKHLGKGLDQAVVYLKLDSIADSDNFDQSTGCDAIGEAYFSKVAPGKYYFFAKGYSRSDKRYVSGSVAFIIANGDQKQYNVTVNTQ